LFEKEGGINIKSRKGAQYEEISIGRSGTGNCFGVVYYDNGLQEERAVIDSAAGAAGR